jgi:hypothetical protein
VLIEPRRTRILVRPDRLLTLRGEDASMARSVLEAATMAPYVPPSGTREAAIAAALLKNGALYEPEERAPAAPATETIRMLVGFATEETAARAVAYVDPFVHARRFQLSIALGSGARDVVSSQGLRWLLSVPVYDSEFNGPTANHALAGNAAEAIVVIGAGEPILRRLATARYDDVLLAACAITRGRVILFAPYAAEDLDTGPFAQVVAHVREEGFDVIPAKDLHPWNVAAIVEAILDGQPYDELLVPLELPPSAADPIRVVYAISGAISAVAAPLSLDQLAWSGGFDLRILATAAAREMVSLEGLRQVYATAPHGGPTELGAWADVVIVDPAAADAVGRIADDDDSDDVALVARLAKRLVVVPSTNSRMWARAAVQRAIDALGARGAHVVLPLGGPEVADPTAPPGFGSAGVHPASVPGLLRLIAREPARA